MKCLSNLSWIGKQRQRRVLSRWFCSYWAANPVNPSRTVCLPAFFILSDREWRSVCRMWLLPHRYRVHLWESNKPVCTRVFVGFLSSRWKSVFFFEIYCSFLAGFHPQSIWESFSTSSSFRLSRETHSVKHKHFSCACVFLSQFIHQICRSKTAINK